MRCDITSDQSPYVYNGVASPEHCVGSEELYMKSPEVQCYSPSPLKHPEKNIQLPSIPNQRKCHWVDSIPAQSVDSIPTEECFEFQVNTEIVTGCVSSHIQPFMYCEVNTAQPTIMDSYSVHSIPVDSPAPVLVQIPQDDPSAEPSLDLTPDISDAEPVCGLSEEALCRVFEKSFAEFWPAQDLWCISSDSEDDQKDSRRKKAKKKKKSKKKNEHDQSDNT